MTLPRTLRIPDRPARRQRGSLLVLAVVVLVLIALMGLAYIQQAKMDRFSTDRFTRDYTELVINGIIAELRVNLEDDYTENWNRREGLYDYPWTMYNPGAADLHKDDRYLAFTFPDVNNVGTGSIVWRHISNLSTQEEPGVSPATGWAGQWLLLPAAPTGTNTPQDEPLEIDIEDRGVSQDEVDSDQFLSVAFLGRRPNGADLTGYGAGGSTNDWDFNGADADGDGIPDSRWQYAPLAVRSFGDLEYVMAVRMIDLSSLVNVNVASANPLTGGELTLSAANGPRGYFPSEADLSRLLIRANPWSEPSSAAGGWYNDWRDGLAQLMRYRMDGAWMAPQPSLGSYPGWSYDPAPASPPRDFNSLADAADSTVFGGYGPKPTQLREAIWARQAAVYGSTENRYTIDSETELRHRGGLNDSDASRAVEGGGSAANWLYGLVGVTRNIDGTSFAPPDPAEGSYENVLNNVVQNTTDAEARWFAGIADNGSGAANPPSSDTAIDADDVDGRSFPAIRHFLTTVSGAAVFKSAYDNGAGLANSRLKLDLNSTLEGDLPVFHASARAALGVMLNEVLFPNPTGQPGDFYGSDWTTQPPLLDTELTGEVIPDYINNIIDYADDDSIPSESTDRFGIERLPFLREAYVQVLYEARDQDDDDGDNNPQTGNPDDWVALAGGGDPDTRALVIELGNPFPGDLDPSDPATDLNQKLRIQVNGETWTWDDAAHASAAPVIGGRDDTVPGGSDVPHAITLVFPPVDPTPDKAGNDADGAADMLSELGATIPAGQRWEIDVPNGEPTTRVSIGSPITIELQVEVNPGDWVTYDRMSTGDTFQNAYDMLVTTPMPGIGSKVYRQMKFARASETLEYLVPDIHPAGDYESTNLENVDYSTYTYSNGINLSLLRDDKVSGALSPGWPAATLPEFNDLQFIHPDRPDTDGRPFYSTTELAVIPMFGFTRTATVGEALWALNLEPKRWFLDIDPDDPTTNNWTRLPYAAMLFDAFTTVSPRYTDADEDNYDGDESVLTPGAPADRPREQLVPGLINVNTAPIHLLTLAAPIPQSLDDTQTLMETIVAHRDGYQGTLPPTRSGGPLSDAAIQGRPGIASLGELLFLNPSAGVDQPEDMQQYLNAALPGAWLNILPKPEDGADGLGATAAPGPEGAIAKFQYLSQLLSTRSDIYAAYVKIRGYKAGAYDLGPQVEAEFVVVLDRSNVVRTNAAPGDEQESPRVLAYTRLR